MSEEQSMPAQGAAVSVIQIAREYGLLDSPVAVAPELAEKERVLMLAMLRELDARRRVHPELPADDVAALFTFVFAKAAEAVTEFFSGKSNPPDLKGMLDGVVPLYADEAVTAEFKESEFPVDCAENYLNWFETDRENLAGYDPLLVLFEALKWFFRLSCHWAVEIIEEKKAGGTGGGE